MGHLWLIGMMGSGKTTVGRIVAERLAVPFYDTDAIIEQDQAASVETVFAAHGEAAFRRIEADTVARVAGEPAGIVATGGGVVLDDRNVASMRESGTTVLFDADVDTLIARVGDGEDRPLLSDDGASAIRRIADARAERYRAAADIIVDGSGTAADVAKEVEALWRRS